MSLAAVRTCSVLNGLAAGQLQAPNAEQVLRRPWPGQHHLAGWLTDPEGLFGDQLQVSLRLVLARVAVTPTPWMLALVAPGRAGGLRGSTGLRRQVGAMPLDPNTGGAGVVLSHDGALALLPDRSHDDLGDGAEQVWQVRSAERPLLPATPAEARLALRQVIGRATATIAASGMSAGVRPEPAATVDLGAAYAAANQQLLDQALSMVQVAAAATASADLLPSAHDQAGRRAAVTDLGRCAMDGISAAVSWPRPRAGR